MTPVSLVSCENYDIHLLKRKIREGLGLIGFDLDQLKNRRIALKPNLLIPHDPERAVITHPLFFQAAAEILKEYSTDIVVAESPNFFPLRSTMKKTGYMDIAEKLGLEVRDNTKVRTLNYKGAKNYKSIEISEVFFDVDVIVNMPKLKTHGFTHYTGAVKNLFGTIPGLRKSKMHMKAPAHKDFAGFILDLYGALLHGFEKKKTFIHIMDAVVGLEGEGPGPSGKPKHIGALLASTDALAMDYIASQLIGLDLKKIFIITQGLERGYGITSPDQISLKGGTLEEMKVSGFQPSKNSAYSGIVWPLTSRTIKNLFTEKPVPMADKCVLCYHCKTVCPAGAITKASKNEKVPRYDYRKCIRCFCCMETCPESAIKSQRGLLQWKSLILDRITKN